MHGSLNWINNQELGLVNLSKLPANLATESIGHPPHLIFGTDIKLTGEQPFFTMAHLFYEKLSKAEVLVCIGYGFANGYVNSLVTQAKQ
jgi:hypothetical protein